jgi:hypothetical protein
MKRSGLVAAAILMIASLPTLAQNGATEKKEAIDKLINCETNLAEMDSDTNPNATEENIASDVYPICQSLREKVANLTGVPLAKIDKARDLQFIRMLVIDHRWNKKNCPNHKELPQCQGH